MAVNISAQMDMKLTSALISEMVVLIYQHQLILKPFPLGFS